MNDEDRLDYTEMQARWRQSALSPYVPMRRWRAVAIIGWIVAGINTFLLVFSKVGCK